MSGVLLRAERIFIPRIAFFGTDRLSVDVLFWIVPAGDFADQAITQSGVKQLCAIHITDRPAFEQITSEAFPIRTVRHRLKGCEDAGFMVHISAIYCVSFALEYWTAFVTYDQATFT